MGLYEDVSLFLRPLDHLLLIPSGLVILTKFHLTIATLDASSNNEVTKYT
jgi:hypothetical protein